MNNWTEQHSSWNYLYAQSIDWYSYWMIWDKRYSYHTKRNTHKSHTKQNIQIEKTKNSYRKSNSKGHNQWNNRSESEESPLTLSAKSSARISQLFDQTWLSRYPRPTKAIFEKGFHTIPIFMIRVFIRSKFTDDFMVSAGYIFHGSIISWPFPCQLNASILTILDW